ncbi:NADH-quinone oxidoreductase subunit NuoN [Roseicitreum antarcticum]|uniref:NADH-quinone oxidoreductase subunit N n=1 Tax=Roseicitreum antarcticum TaxID=564137 RepID=A0A1H2ZSV2_9RHOB|nr:NADH-quinone oxidoreductase subunit NuoN [Roseicitreum antarcticum]SDX20367.1 NADH dehydrogenase subunit N [Roseicitreum antarcticum]
MIASDLLTALPEIVLALFAMAALMFGAFGGKDKVAGIILWATAAMFVLVALYIGVGEPASRLAFGGMFIADAFAQFSKMIILISAAVVLVMGQNYMARADMMRFEYPVLVALSVVGMMVMVSAGDLIILYMGLELQSLALYVIASIRRDSLKSTEAGLKYFVLGALASGMLLYGASLTYGFAGTTSFAGIISTIGEEGMPVGVLMGLAFMLAGLAFKVSAVPFHMWTPDVYEGSPTPVTAFFATAPKVAAMALLARLVFDAFGAVPGDWTQIVALLATASMFLGAVAAIGQTDIKRLMAYSSITHMGFALVGLAAGTAEGVQAMLIYMAIYVTMNIGVFAFILSMRRDGRAVSDIASLNQYAKAEPLRALALLILMFSLAGVPPLVGFVGKFYVLWAAVQADMAWLAVAGVIASVIGAFYYMRIVYFMYFGKDGAALDSGMPPLQVGLLVASAAIMVLGMVNLFGIESMAALAADALVR